MTSTAQSLQEFVNYTRQYITGDEKGQAQIFLHEFFRAFGHEGALQAGATYEERIHKGSKKGKTGFADLVWKPRVLIEMKKRGADLSKHYSQAFDYWQRAVPNRPRYVMLCNFDEFWIYDFDTQIDTPIDQVLLAQLPERVATFGFMEVQEKKPVFGNNQVEVTEKAAGRMGELFQMLQARLLRTGQAESTHQASMMAQRYVLQCVLAMFAEDRGLLPGSLFVQCVQDCLAGASSYDVIGGLFREMNTPGITPAGRYQGVDYFNGGLFSEIHLLQLTDQELKFLEVSALEDWGKIRPAIFGNIFESAIDQNERHAHGIHYTSEADIMKIVRPTISRYWEERIEQANTIGQLLALQDELRKYRVLDPACGSGNFLYIAYQELKQIEQDLLDKIMERRRTENVQIQMGFVTPLQLFGIDNNPFAVELARVTLMIARKVAIDRLGLYEPALPLDTLDRNIVCRDALFTDWPQADAIIGNPPFLGGYRMRQELGDEYTERIFEKFSDVRDKVDFCTYWFRLSHLNLQHDGRAGLVGTNSIRQGNSRRAGLDYILHNGGFIHEAISTQDWSGEANVDVSIINWCYKEPDTYYLDNEKVEGINSSLDDLTDVSKSASLKANKNYSFKGIQPTGGGFLVEKSQVDRWTSLNKNNQDVLKLFSDAITLAQSPNGKPNRWIIDFNDMTLEEASEYELPFDHVKTNVKPGRDNNRRESTRIYWWQYGEKRPALRAAIADLSCYFSVPRHSKWFTFVPAQLNWLPADSTTVVSSDDFYILGLLTANLHRLWTLAQSSTLEDRIRYTHNTCFETFPFPQAPAPETVQAIRAKALELHQYRSEQMEQKQWGITKLYNAYFDEEASQLYKLHKQLDALVLEAYGFSPADDLLEKLLALNLELAAKEKAGVSVVGPWAPDRDPKN